MDILKDIQDSWGWIGLNPVEVVTENDFGNLILKDGQDAFWRICPEELECEIIAKSIEEYNELIKDEEFVQDWFMQALVNKAKKALGDLSEGQKYCLKTPIPFGGDYKISNVKTAPLIDLVRASGDMAKQIKDLPDGAKVKLNWV